MDNKNWKLWLDDQSRDSECPARPTLNDAASLASDLVLLRQRIAETDKDARRTPARTMVKERALVAAARAALPGLCQRFDSGRVELHRLCVATGWGRLLVDWLRPGGGLDG